MQDSCLLGLGKEGGRGAFLLVLDLWPYSLWSRCRSHCTIRSPVPVALALSGPAITYTLHPMLRAHSSEQPSLLQLPSLRDCSQLPCLLFSIGPQLQHLFLSKASDMYGSRKECICPQLNKAQAACSPEQAVGTICLWTMVTQCVGPPKPTPPFPGKVAKYWSPG